MEAVALVENSRTLDELESYFKNYPDLPREVVLKHDLLRDGHWFTDAALGVGLRCPGEILPAVFL